MDNPKVTVLMPVYNGETYLAEAIESILVQTFKKFEFLIINDSSTDNSLSIIKEYAKKDARVKLANNQKERGIVGGLNTGLELAKGKYIARMDSDDVSLPDRLEIQVKFMDENPEVGVCGSWIKLFGKADSIVKNPVDHNEIMCNLLFFNAIAHPSVMIRTALFKKYDLKYLNFPHAEDFELWTRCSFLFKLHNIPKFLLNYRVSGQNITSQKKGVLAETAYTIFKKKLVLLGISPNKEVAEFHKFIGDKMVFESEKQLKKAGFYLFSLYKKNKTSHVYPKREFNKMLLNFWFTICLKSKIKYTNKMFICFFLPIKLIFEKNKQNDI
jgi:glycosyltransferase involved in cell wall biosynthesis